MNCPSVEGIKSIITKHNLRLKPGITLMDNDCCPLGALMVEKFGYEETERLRKVGAVTNIHPVVFLSDKLGITVDEAWSVIRGFDQSGFGSEGSWYQLGRACRELADN